MSSKTPSEIREAQRRLNNLASFVRRPGLTGWVKDRDASWQYQRAFEAIVAAEDALGVDAVAKVSDRLTSLRHEAERAHLLTPGMISDAEREAIREIDDRKYAARLIQQDR
jgi:hypothetical protein